MRVLVRTEKYVIYTDGDRTYLCSPEAFEEKYGKEAYAAVN